MDKSQKCYDHIHKREYGEAYKTAPIKAESLVFNHRDNVISLSGKWKFTPDVFDTFTRKNYLDPNIGRDVDGRATPIDYHFGQGHEIDVPGCWNGCEREFFLYEGTGIYTRTFDYEKKDGMKRVFLRISAANYEARVVLNGKFIGRHIGGFTPFCIELEDLQEKDNRLMVLVNNTRKFEQLPSENYDWFNYGGITGKVDLVPVPESFIRSFHTNLVPGSDYSRIAFKAVVDGKAEKCTFRIPELGVEVTAPVVDGCAECIVEAKPVLWDVKNPKLYEVSAEIEGDRVSDEIGYRDVRVEGRKIYLNGREIFLKGICCHDESSEISRLRDDEEKELVFDTVLDLGGNAMRLTHYPHNEEMARIADRKGILLWEEIPVYWLLDFQNPETYADAENQLSELIERDYNRASVIIWSIGNENPDTDERLSFMKRLSFKARELDSTRLISAACLSNMEHLRVEDRLADYVDVVAINEYYGWYQRNFEDLRKLLANSVLDKPLVITETGAGAEAGFHGDEEEIFTEEHQAQVYRKQTEYTDGYVEGLFPWILYDFRSPVRMNDHQKYYNVKGIVASDKKTRKMAFSVLQDYYHGR